MKGVKMRAIFIVLVTLFSINSQAWFRVNANCQLFSGVRAACEACNWQGRPMYCKMKIKGRTSYGAWFNGNQSGWVGPGLCISGYVAANNPYRDPLVSANAKVRCRF